MIRNAGALVRGYVVWVRRLPQANGMMFAAQSSWGRSVKIGLFGIGVVMPLGSLIRHGNGVRKRAVVLPVDLTKTLPAPTGDS